jgi:hypothetical protein
VQLLVLIQLLLVVEEMGERAHLPDHLEFKDLTLFFPQ